LLVKLRHILGAFLALFLVAAVAAPASAQYGSTVGNGKVSKGAVKPGECVTFSGDGFAPGSEVEITDNGANLGTATAGATGSFTFQVCPTVAGVHILRGTGVDALGNTRTVVARVTVAGRRLSTTGSDSTVPALLAGLGLVVAGSGSVLAGSRLRRRRQTAS
jgi:hypothetical protein